jgi:putative Ig domain-containing protein/flagellar hook capping protein FlgD
VLRFTAVAHDAENGTLVFSGSPLPSGATLDASTGQFSWTPLSSDDGVYHLTVQVHDPQAAADSQAVTLTVTPSAPAGSATCTPDTSSLNGTIGVNAYGAQDVSNEHSFVVPAGVAEIRGALSWTGGPAIDLDLYLVDAAGNVVSQGATATLDPEHLLYIGPAPGTYRWRVSSFTNPNPTLAYTVSQTLCMGQVLAVGDADFARSVTLAQNFPNPFQRSSTIRFAVPRAQQVTLRIYDIAGRTVRTLVSGRLEAGAHQRVWDGRTDAGHRASAGVYFYRLDSEQGQRVRRMVMLQ